MVGFAILWWVIASGLLFVTWNRVLVGLFKLGKVKWWQPFLVVLTVCVLAAPCALKHRGSHGSCERGSGCAHESSGGHEAAGAHHDCGGDCKGHCDGKCEHECTDGQCADGKCPHHKK